MSLSKAKLPLPVHGFVLAGGKSSRMGRDKALLPFRGRPMVEIAVEKLRSFCAAVSVAGNREDLAGFAPVVRETRVDAGPVAGIEAGVKACREPWALFMPVDVPLVPARFLRTWVEEALSRAGAGCGMSSLLLSNREQPAFCLIRREYDQVVNQIVRDGERKIRNLLGALEQDGTAGWMWLGDAEEIARDLLDPEYPDLQLTNWFANVNTPDELLETEVGCGPA